MKFKIWYENNDLEGNSVEDWMSFPNTGIVGILEYFDNLRYRISTGSDWYWLEGTDVVQSNTTHEFPDHFVENPVQDNPSVKSGKWVSDDRMNQVDSAIRSIIDNG